MRYYLDTEFDGHGGPLISMALLREDGKYVYYVVREHAEDPWVQEHVISVLDEPKGCVGTRIPETELGYCLFDFIKDDSFPEIVSDSPVDITYFTKVISTDRNGNWKPCGLEYITLTVETVDCYPTELKGMIQHNALCDVMALQYKLEDPFRKSRMTEKNAWRLDFRNLGVFYHDKFVRLSRGELRVLELLLQNTGQVVTVSQLEEYLESRTAGDKLIDVYICRIKTKLRTISSEAANQITTCWGRGYALILLNQQSIPAPTIPKDVWMSYVPKRWTKKLRSEVKMAIRSGALNKTQFMQDNRVSERELSEW